LFKVTCRYFSDNEKKLNQKEFQHLLVMDEIRKHSNGTSGKSSSGQREVVRPNVGVVCSFQWFGAGSGKLHQVYNDARDNEETPRSVYSASDLFLLK
jgi:hypothetical protein